jgi:hypothetical protein
VIYSLVVEFVSRESYPGRCGIYSPPEMQTKSETYSTKLLLKKVSFFLSGKTVEKVERHREKS